MDEFGAMFLVKMKRDLAIGVGCERHAFGGELSTDGFVAVEFAVHNAVHISTPVDDGLIAIHQPDDAEPDMAKCHAPIGR